MRHLVISVISFAGIFGGVLIGRFFARRLPGHNLSSETQSVVTVSVAVIGTLSALVLGLMISAANTSFSARSDEVRELSLQLIRMDRNLRRYGPEADNSWSKLHEWAVAKNLGAISKGRPTTSNPRNHHRSSREGAGRASLADTERRTPKYMVAIGQSIKAHQKQITHR